MKRNLLLFAITVILAFGFSWESSAQHRRVVVRNRPNRTSLVIRAGHPIRRRLPATVLVRPAHRAVVVGAPLVFLPALRWTAPVVSLPARERLAWQDVLAACLPNQRLILNTSLTPPPFHEKRPAASRSLRALSARTSASKSPRR